MSVSLISIKKSCWSASHRLCYPHLNLSLCHLFPGTTTASSDWSPFSCLWSLHSAADGLILNHIILSSELLVFCHTISLNSVLQLLTVCGSSPFLLSVFISCHFNLPVPFQPYSIAAALTCKSPLQRGTFCAYCFPPPPYLLLFPLPQTLFFKFYLTCFLPNSDFC